MKNIRLLLVDDEANFRQPLAKRLTKRGMSLLQAQSGEECLLIIAQQPVVVVVLDVKMPGMNGIETLRTVKKQYPHIEVVLLTGQATTQDGVAGIKSGAFDYLTKPIELEHLVGKITQAYEKILRQKEQQREAEFRAKIEQQMIATERLASLGTLATGVAHEINNPLAIIREAAGWMKLLLKRKALIDLPHRDEFETALNKIENSIERASRITHQLLGFTKKYDSVFSEVKLPELADEAVQLVSREAAIKEIEIDIQTHLTLPSIWSDPYRLRQVFINLLTNAIYAAETGGKISVTFEDKGDTVILKVSDNGEGIPKENLEKIFEPFFSTKSPGQGTGLGLFVTRGIVDKLGGTIEVKSRLGHGSDFYVKLPKNHKTEQASNPDKNLALTILEKLTEKKNND